MAGQQSDEQAPKGGWVPFPAPVVAEATVEDCRADYEDGADIRGRLGWTDPS